MKMDKSIQNGDAPDVKFIKSKQKRPIQVFFVDMHKLPIQKPALDKERTDLRYYIFLMLFTLTLLPEANLLY